MRELNRNEGIARLREYQQKHPRAARMLGSRLLDNPFDGSPASTCKLAERLPALGLSPS